MKVYLILSLKKFIIYYFFKLSGLSVERHMPYIFKNSPQGYGIARELFIAFSYLWGKFTKMHGISLWPSPSILYI